MISISVAGIEKISVAGIEKIRKEYRTFKLFLEFVFKSMTN